MNNKSIFELRNLIILIGVMFLVSCQTTRFVPEDQFLVKKISVNIDNKNIKREEIKSYIRQKENLRILGVAKFHLWLYNLSSKDKENDWWKRIGEAPVLYDEVLSDRSNDQLKIYLRNKGYYEAIVNDSVIFDQKKRKAELIFNINSGKPYRVRKYQYTVDDPLVFATLKNDSVNRLIKPNDIFDLDVLNSERQRMAKLLKNHGYYKTSEEQISFLADTNFLNKRVDLSVIIDPPQFQKDSGEVVQFQKYKIRNYLINPNYQALKFTESAGTQYTDSILIDDYIVYHSGAFKYKPSLFDNLNRMKDSTYYCLQNTEKTYRALNRLRQFKVININFTETNTFAADSSPQLDCRILLTPLARQSFSVDVEGTNSSGNLGVAGNFNYQKRNVFGGAEVLDFQVRGGTERQTTFKNSNYFNFNTVEFGFETTLTFPKFLNFLNLKKVFYFDIPETKLTAGFNYQKRPDYTRNITNIKFGYNWKSSPFLFHNLNLLDLNFVNIYDYDPDFVNSIEDLYIKSSYTDHLISALNYSWMYNTQSINKREDYHYYRFNFESAGNLLWLYSKLFNRETTKVIDPFTRQPIDFYEVLNIRFAQYLKGDFEFRSAHFFNKASSLVGRTFIGIGVPYGNFDVLPFERKFYTGGANGIRAWQVRTLGPGTYKADDDVYPNQSSDIKLEGNIEYRFNLFWLLEGALFVDAGNIWAINSKDNRPGAVFKFNEFYKQIAVGTGAGFRFDFTYFIFRFDVGLKLRDPSLEKGKRFIPGNYPLKSDHLAYSFAIGYPF